MNERIRECWLKAAREDSGEKWDTQEEFIERFAKLIVQECAKEAFEFWCSQDDPTEGSAENHILKRFGVKS